ncbi:MAG: hypothetical protein JNJ54_37065 [Myxococcaceae bacterium]|nr:hypothetical protein [Myxococcaceae bacterium]
MTSPFDVPFRRCARCQHECHAAFTACPSCQASFDTEEQRKLDSQVQREVTNQLAQSARQSAQLEAQRDAADAEARLALKDLQLHERQQELERRRLVNDVLDGEPLRHVFENKTDWDREERRKSGDWQEQDEHRYDDEIAKVRRERAKLRAKAEGPRRPDPRPSNWVSNATLLAVTGAFTVFIAYLMHSRTVAALGFALVVAGLGWAVFRRR